MNVPARRKTQRPVTIPLMRPLLPTFEKLAPYLREIDENRWYTNFGPLVTRFETRLADLFRVPKAQVLTIVNGTAALSGALLAAGAKQGTKCLVPAWTFVASGAAVRAADLIPHFVDVTRETWMPDPDTLSRRADLHEVGAVMVVGPFGTPVDTAAWERFSTKTGIPVVIDAAACFDAVASVPAARPRNVPTVISLHATKALGVGEGGLVISSDDEIMLRLRRLSNFGIWGRPEGTIVGFNGKMSEYHAAVGLAALDGWAERRAALVSRTQRYAEALAHLPQVKTLPAFGQGSVSVYCIVCVPGDIDAIIERLSGMGIESRRWWLDGVHALAAYQSFDRDDLTVTGELASSALALPFSHDISDADIQRVVECLETTLE